MNFQFKRGQAIRARKVKGKGFPSLSPWGKEEKKKSHEEVVLFLRDHARKMELLFRK